MVSIRRGVTAALVATVLTVPIVTACSGSGSEGVDHIPAEPSEPTSLDHFGYQVNQPLVTTNAGTQVGVAANAHLIAGRLYPAAYVPGPSGESIPNTDLVTIQMLPGPQRQVMYRLSDEATFSDGEPVTCVDFLLTHTASDMPQQFGSHLPLLDQVERVDCELGSKEFTVVFHEDQGARWRNMFGPGTLLPAHAIAAEAGMSMEELFTALHGRDAGALAEVARIWRDGFNLNDFNPALQVSSGPYRIKEVGEHGEVVLVRNEHYYGDAPALDTLVVWPRAMDSQTLRDAGALRIADTPVLAPDWVDRHDPTNPYDVESRVGDLTESLKLSNVGVLGQPWAREAFAACVDQRAVAAVSSEQSGVEVPPVALQVVQHDDPIRYHLTDIADPHLEVDLGLASGLAGSTIRIGYLGPDERKAAMVQAIADACEPAGITVVDNSAEGWHAGHLGAITYGEWGEEMVEEGTIDAFLGAIDPMSEYRTVSARLTEVQELREAERQMWEEIPFIPLAAEPRAFVVERSVGNVVVYTGLAGIGWNMDRWHIKDGTSTDGTGEFEPNGTTPHPEH